MPSQTSHGLGHYYAHASNAFWWIVGEALGFRRGGPAEDKPWPDQFKTKPSKSVVAVLSSSGPVLNYQEQVAALTSAGYCLWDVVRECHITNSDDHSVRNQRPNDIRKLVEVNHPTIKRIVFASGKTSAKLFVKMNKTWLGEGKFLLRGDTAEEVFSRYTKCQPDHYSGETLQLIVPFSVSPACASVSFKPKLDQWREMVFN